MIADRLLVPADSPQQAAYWRERLQQVGYTVEQGGSPYLVKIALPLATLEAVPEALAALAAADFGGLRAEPDYLRFPALEPDDPELPGQYAHERMDSCRAWDVTAGSPDVVLAILDTGMDLDHPDLAANLWTNPGEIAGNGLDDDGNGYVDDVHGWDVYADDNMPNDTDGHGTHVAGVAGAVGNNAVGVAGVNWSVALLPVRLGEGSFAASEIVEALDYIYDLRTKRGIPIVVSNNSYVGAVVGESEREAIERQGEAGIVFVCAAGNQGVDVEQTEVYPGVLSGEYIVNVASSDAADKLADSSNYGVESVDLAAPGVSILSTAIGGGYVSRSGTSMAAPQVSGALALAFAVDPEMDWRELRSALLESVDPVPALSGVTVTVDGLISDD